MTETPSDDNNSQLPPMIQAILDALFSGNPVVISGQGPEVTGFEILNPSGSHEHLSQEEIDEDHERMDALFESVRRTGTIDIMALSDADKLRQLALRLLMYGSEHGLCVHRDHNPVAWMLLPIADRLELLDAGIAES